MVGAETTENKASEFTKLKQKSKIRSTHSISKHEQDQKRKNLDSDGLSKSPVTGDSIRKKAKTSTITKEEQKKEEEKKKLFVEKPNAKESTSEKSVTQGKESA